MGMSIPAWAPGSAGRFSLISGSPNGDWWFAIAQKEVHGDTGLCTVPTNPTNGYSYNGYVLEVRLYVLTRPSPPPSPSPSLLTASPPPPSPPAQSIVVLPGNTSASLQAGCSGWTWLGKCPPGTLCATGVGITAYCGDAACNYVCDTCTYANFNWPYITQLDANQYVGVYVITEYSTAPCSSPGSGFSNWYMGSCMLGFFTPVSGTCTQPSSSLTPPPPPPPPFPPPPFISSCRAALDGVYQFNAAPPFSVYCMGGYALLAKMRGDLSTWSYESDLWTTDTLLNSADLTANMTEAKLEAFTRLPISELRLGMVPLSGGDASWVNISLTSVLTNLQKMFTSSVCGTTVDPTCVSTFNAFSGCVNYAHCSASYVQTSLGRSAWSGLVGSSGLEYMDVAEGFNSISGGCVTVRIGFRANDDSSGMCIDSAIGFGLFNYGSPVSCSVGLVTGTPVQRFGFILGR